MERAARVAAECVMLCMALSDAQKISGRTAGILEESDHDPVSNRIAAVLQAVREDRLWQRHMDMASIGATGRGGVNRQALTAEDTEARARLLAWAARRGFSASADAIGNVFIRSPWQSTPTASPVVAGSHLDTQPTGGNFDGVYGVLAAFEVLEAAADAGVTTHPPARSRGLDQ